MKIRELLGEPHKKISADRFLEAFREQWKEEDPDEIIETYNNNENWTEFMLGNVTGNQIGDVFLNRVAKRLLMTMDREWRKLDCVYYKKESCQIDGDDRTPACLDAIIEHENDADVEQEMYKLLIFRSPLKVLMFNDWNEDEKTSGEREEWLNSRLGELLKMGSEFEARWPEAYDTEYLFLVGNRLKEGGMPRWRYMTVRSGEFERRSRLSPSEFLQLL